MNCYLFQIFAILHFVLYSRPTYTQSRVENSRENFREGVLCGMQIAEILMVHFVEFHMRNILQITP